MKTRSVIILAVCVIFALGAAKCDLSDPLSQLAVKNASRGLGYAVAQSRTTADDQAVIAAYDLLTKGQLSEVAMTQLLIQLKGSNPLVVFAAIDLLEAMGAVINKVQGAILDLSPITPEMWAVVEASYKQGYQLGAVDKLAGVTRAVP